MRNDPFGQGRYEQQQGAPRRRGLFGNVRWWILIAFAGYAAFSWISSKRVDPYTGQDAHYGATPEEEVQLGAQAFQEVIGDANSQGALLPPSSPQSQEVAEIAKRLIKMVPQVSADLAAAHGQQASTDYQNFEWSAAVINSQEANAFCLPGGKIAVYTGLLPITQTTESPQRVCEDHPHYPKPAETERRPGMERWRRRPWSARAAAPLCQPRSDQRRQWFVN